jgi:hypothetical protein
MTAFLSSRLLMASAITVVLLSMPVLSHAQFEPRQSPGLLSIGGMVGAPRGAFADNIPHPGGGFVISYGSRLPYVPIVVGMELGYFLYGFNFRQEPFRILIPDVRLEVTTLNSILMPKLFLRIQPDVGLIRPYMEGLIGMQWLVTTTTVDRDGGYFEEDDTFLRTIDALDIAYNYGFGGGMMFRLYDERGTGTSSTWGNRSYRSVWLDMRVRYLEGSQAEYLDTGTVRRVSGRASYDVLNSRTDMITVYLGLSMDF